MTSQTRDMTSVKGALSLQEIIQTLVGRGCPDVTLELDNSLFSEYPIHGGGFGDIFSGHMQDGRKVAVKCARYRQEEETDRRNMKLMARELYAWSKCQHPNVLELVGLAQHRGQLATVSPWMENKTLPEYLVRNPGVNRVDMCRQVASGLAYLHQFKMIHGDLKGANVLISDTGIAKLTDFGSTKLNEYTLRFTTQTSVPYSLRWAAPEVLNGFTHSTESDVYSLGMTILEVTTGKVPYEDKPEMSVLVEIVIHKRPPTRDDKLIQIQENKSSLWELMTKCWSHDGSTRPPAAEVHAQLAIILNDQLDQSVLTGDSSALLSPMPHTRHQMLYPPSLAENQESFLNELLVHFTKAYLVTSNNDAEWRNMIVRSEHDLTLRTVDENQAQIIVDVNQNGEATFETRHVIANANGITTLPHAVPAGADDVLPVLISAARWNRLVNLTNQEHPFASSFDMHFTRLASNFNDYDADGNRTRRTIGPNLNETGTAHVLLQDGDLFGLELVNKSDQDLYHSLFYFDIGKQAIHSCYPRSSGNAPVYPPLRAKSTFTVGYGSTETAALSYRLEPGQDLAIGVLKLLITTRPTNLQFMEQLSPFDSSRTLVQRADLTKEMHSHGVWDSISMTLVQRRPPKRVIQAPSFRLPLPAA